MNIKRIISKCVYPVNDEIAWTEKRYQNACRIVSDIIDTHKNIAPEDKQQRKWDLAKILWEDVYGNYREELILLKKTINTFKK